MPTDTMCRVEVIAKGSPLEMGIAQGQSLREKIQLASGIVSQIYGFRMLQPRWMPYSLYLRICEQKASRFLEEPLKREFPDAYQRLKGLSAGSQTSMKMLQLLHAMEPMLSDVRGCATVPAFGACSAVAVRGRRSATGEPVIARNFDYLKLVQPLYTVRESRPSSGYRSIDFTMAPFAGAIDGVNEKGLCITYDYASVSDFSSKGAGPISVAIAEALQHCSTAAEAAERIGSRPRWGGALLMLADAGGDIASLELSNTRWQIRRPAVGEDTLFHSNCFVTETMRSVEVPASAVYTDRAPEPLRRRRVHESSEVRNQRFAQLLAGDVPLDEDKLTRIMGDHETGGKSGDTSICKHSDYWNTTATLQLFPVSRRMRVSFSSACKANYAEVML